MFKKLLPSILIAIFIGFLLTSCPDRRPIKTEPINYSLDIFIK